MELLEAGADPSKDCEAVLHLMHQFHQLSETKFVSMIQKLLQYGADVNFVFRTGFPYWVEAVKRSSIAKVGIKLCQCF